MDNNLIPYVELIKKVVAAEKTATTKISFDKILKCLPSLTDSERVSLRKAYFINCRDYISMLWLD